MDETVSGVYDQKQIKMSWESSSRKSSCSQGSKCSRWSRFYLSAKKIIKTD